MTVTVAGLAMWKKCSKAVTLGMPLSTFQITSKGDMRGRGVRGEYRYHTFSFCWPEILDFALQ